METMSTSEVPEDLIKTDISDNAKHGAQPSKRPPYTPLNPLRRETRILEVHPGYGDHVVECTLHIVSLPCTAVGVCHQNIEKLRKMTWEDSDDCVTMATEMLRSLHFFRQDMLLGVENNDFWYLARNLVIILYALKEIQRIVHEFLHQAGKSDVTLKTVDATRKFRFVDKSIGDFLHLYDDVGPTMESSLRVLEPDIVWIPPVYEAISYSWGKSRAKRPIKLNDVEFEAPVSSVQVLERFRLRDQSRMVWIDAICLDQDDHKEKETQIPMMADIYCFATKTLAWLGDSAGDAGYVNLVAAFCERLDAFFEPDGTSSRTEILGNRTDHCDWLLLKEISPNSTRSLAVYHPLDPEYCAKISTSSLDEASKVLQHLSRDPEGYGYGSHAKRLARGISLHNLTRELKKRPSPLLGSGTKAIVSLLTPRHKLVSISRHEILKPAPGSEAFRALLDFMGPKDTSIALNALKTLIEREWFTRLWVFQEMVNSQNLICHVGEEAIQLRCLKLAIDFFSGAEGPFLNQLSMDSGYPSINFIALQVRLNTAASTDVPLWRLVWSSRTLGVSVPFDRIYAVVAMSHWIRSGLALPAGLRPNYSQSLRDCICAATKVMIAEINNLQVLSIPGVRIGLDEEGEVEGKEVQVARALGNDTALTIFQEDADLGPWPSWCPRWHQEVPEQDAFETSGLRLHAFTGVHEDDRADMGRKLSPETSIDCSRPRSLFLEGLRVDSIASTCPLPARIWACLEQYVRATNDGGESRSNTDTGSLSTDLGTLILASEGPHPIIDAVDEICGSLTITSNSRARVLDMLLPPNTSHDAGEIVQKLSEGVHGPELHDLAIGVLREIVGTSTHCNMFITSKGRMGVGPTATRPNDTVAVLWGGSVPYVLRSGGDHHLFVGVARVEGLMRGEAVREWEANGGTEATSFELR